MEGTDAFKLSYEGLERAAKAARELDKSAHAQAAVELSREAERTKQLEITRAKEEMVARQKAFEVERIERQADEQRKLMDAETKHAQQRAYYEDQLARKRHQDQLASQRFMKEEERKKHEESLLRLEQLKRDTITYEAELRRQAETARVEVETAGRIKQERDNHDLYLEKKEVEATEYRKTVLGAIRQAGSTIGNGVRDFLADPDRIVAAAGMLSLAATGVYAAKACASVAGRVLESRLGTPSLVRETTRGGPTDIVRHPVTTLQRLFVNSPDDALHGLVLAPQLRKRLRSVAVSSLNARRNDAHYRHVLLHGPPGTGKTMFAKGLARHSGMDYAIMAGSDVAPLGRNAVTEIHKLFDWSDKSSRGLLLFIDEADAFLRRRGPSTNRRHNSCDVCMRVCVQPPTFVLRLFLVFPTHTLLYVCTPVAVKWPTQAAFAGLPSVRI